MALSEIGQTVVAQASSFIATARNSLSTINIQAALERIRLGTSWVAANPVRGVAFLAAAVVTWALGSRLISSCWRRVHAAPTHTETPAHSTKQPGTEASPAQPTTTPKKKDERPLKSLADVNDCTNLQSFIDRLELNTRYAGQDKAKRIFRVTVGSDKDPIIVRYQENQKSWQEYSFSREAAAASV